MNPKREGLRYDIVKGGKRRLENLAKTDKLLGGLFLAPLILLSIILFSLGIWKWGILFAAMSIIILIRLFYKLLQRD